MRYSPYLEEYSAFDSMNESQILEYFLTRVFETEEVWGVDDGVEWLIATSVESLAMPLWPYQKLADEFIQSNSLSDYRPEAQSLEDFLNSTLMMLIDDDVMVEIMPCGTKPGCLIAPQRLLSILEGMMEAGEYTLDG